MRIAGHGLSVALPAGWEARITRRGEAGPVLHVASFPLHPSDGDFGAAATGRMRRDDVFAALLEYRDASMIRPGTGLFADLGQPTPDPREFSPRQLQVTRPGQLGWQRFFTSSGRASCLYVVVKPASASVATLVGALNNVLPTIERSGDSQSPAALLE